MKKALLFTLIALLGGFTLGSLFGSGISSVSLAVSDRGSSTLPMQTDEVWPDSGQTVPSDASQSLTDCASAVLEALKAEDFDALSVLVHPVKGVTLTPYSTVNTDCDRTLMPAQLAVLPEDTKAYLWGIEDGAGTPIELTGTEYFARYVFNADYTAAPQWGVDTIFARGNALENVTDAYPQGSFVEYHFPGLDEDEDGYDWCSLKLVFERYQGQWLLVGMIHSEWTI